MKFFAKTGIACGTCDLGAPMIRIIGANGTFGQAGKIDLRRTIDCPAAQVEPGGRMQRIDLGSVNRQTK